MAVYVAAHKAFKKDLPQGYIPLQVGAAGKEKLGYLSDDTGDNISEKNPNFCELTGVYWIWKNRSDDFAGLVHYRRYFTKGGKILTSQQIEKTLENYDIILAKPEYLRESAYEEFSLHSGHEKDLVLLRDVIQKLYPNYLPAFETVMTGNKLHLYNMMITDFKKYSAYCEWLFDILFELEKNVDMTGYTPYESRLYGFLSERLLNVWVLHNGLRVCNMRVLNTDMGTKEKLKLFLRRQKNRIMFALCR